MFESLRVYYRARSGGHNRDILSIFFNMKVYCVFSLESPQQGDSNEFTQYTISQYKKENHPNLSQICYYGICSKGPKNEFETAVVNKSRKKNPQKPTQLSSRSHPRHLVGKRTAQKTPS